MPDPIIYLCRAHGHGFIEHFDSAVPVSVRACYRCGGAVDWDHLGRQLAGYLRKLADECDEASRSDRLFSATALMRIRADRLETPDA